MKRLLFAALAALATPAFAEMTWYDAPLWGQVGNWQVRIDPQQTKGCFILTQWTGGTSVRIGIDTVDEGKTTAYMLIGNPAWQSVQPGQQRDLVMQFGNLPPWKLQTYALKWSNVTMLMAPMIDQSKVLDEMSTQPGIKFYYDGRLVDNLALTDSAAALQSLATCHQTTFARKPDPFATGRTTVSDPFKRM
jgi:hypothetical protein